MTEPSAKNPQTTAYDEATLRFYAQEASAYVARPTGGASPRLDGFLALLPAGARILELGCGGGRDSEAMLARGFDVEPTDGVAAIAAQAEARLKRPVRVLRFDELDAVERYDAVWAQASLLHVPRPTLPRVLALVRRALKPGGLHFASYKGGGAAGRDRFARYFNYPTRAEIVDAYRQAGEWETVSVVDYDDVGYDGRQGPWVGVTVRRPAAR